MSIQTVRLDTISLVAGTFERVASNLLEYAKSGDGGYVCACNAHMISLASSDENLRTVLENSTVNLMDGMPLVWWANSLGLEAERVAGPDLIRHLFGVAERTDISIFLYGVRSHQLKRVKLKLLEEFPNINLAGSFAPPWMNTRPDFYPDHVERINQSGADLVLVGLGCPKQEFWMDIHAEKLDALCIGVGAAFDFYSGRIKRAPVWMQKSGLEWLHRFVQEPTRLWRRYTVHNLKFLYYLWRHRTPSFN